MKRGIFFILSLGLIVACSKQPLSTESTNNADISVERLFDIDGCRVYRFMDYGDPHYFVRCGNVVTTSSSHPCDKNKTCDENIETYQ